MRMRNRVLVLAAFVCFFASVTWPLLRKRLDFASWKGRPPFECVFPDPVLIHQDSPKPFNLFNRLGFLFLIIRLSVLHPDFTGFIRTFFGH